MSAAAVTFRWRDGRLEPRDDCDTTESRLQAADSWLVDEGCVLALQLHLSRFSDAVATADADFGSLDPVSFVDSAVAAIPRDGRWFPRLDARLARVSTDGPGVPELLFRLRPAPEARRSVVLATHRGRDPRTRPRVKGPDLEAMTRLRSEAQGRRADEAVLLTHDGSVAEGSTSCLVWWRGDALCLPEDDIERVDSVTVRSLLALATALGVDVLHERATLSELEGLEVWALNALHGIRIVTGWVDGPDTAEQPGRLDLWRRRLDALRRPLPAVAGAPA